MANKGTYDSAPIVMTRFTVGFAEVDYSMPLNGPYDITIPLQAIQQEASAKGMAVIVQIAMIPLDEFWGVSDEKEPDETDDGPTE